MHAILRKPKQQWAIGPLFTLLALLCGSSTGQKASASTQKLQLTAALVLTPEFCATTTKKGNEKFLVGKAACAELAPALKAAFASLATVDDPSKAGAAQVVLEPKFVDVAATSVKIAFSNRELDVVVEWTVRDQSGKVLLLETVQGSAKRHGGNAFTYGSNLKHIVEDSAKDMAQESAGKISAAPEMLQVSGASAK
jgi:hypothetical protein